MPINTLDPRIGRYSGETTVTGAGSLAYDVLYKCTGGPYTLTLPAPNARRSLALYNDGSGLITLSGTFGPSNDQTLLPGEILFVISDGTSFYTQKEYWTATTTGSSGSASDENTSRSWFGI